MTIVPFLVECDYCTTFGRIGNQLPYRVVCDYCAIIGSIIGS